MAIYSKNEFAEKCNMKSNGLSVYIGRGTVILNENGLIDTKDEKNKHFLEKREGRFVKKEKGKDLKIEDIHTSNSKSNGAILPATQPDGELPSYTESERRLKYLDTLKRNREIQLLQIKEHKLKGEVIPSALIGPVVLRHNQSIMTTFKNGAEDLLRLYGHKHGFSIEEIAKMRGEIIRITNKAITDATLVTTSSIESIINEYSQLRAQGERK